MMILSILRLAKSISFMLLKQNGFKQKVFRVKNKAKWREEEARLTSPLACRVLEVERMLRMPQMTREN